MISHDSGFSRILNYFQLTRQAFRKNQYSLVEKGLHCSSGKYKKMDERLYI